MCTGTDAMGSSVTNEQLKENTNKIDKLDIDDDYSSSSDDEEQRQNLDKYCNHTEQYKNNPISADNMTQVLHSRIAEAIFIKNSSNVDVGHKFYLNETSVGQVEGLLEHIISQKSREKSDNIDKPFPMISRVRWLAQPPLEEREYLNKPVKYVIITHTATEEGFDQSKNILLVRTAQTFHIESHTWADIAYNFMIGSDGNVYEGRGWNVVGSHTIGYNYSSVGIAFVGCFLKHLPPKCALEKCHKLIEYGVNNGYISEDYELLAHRQCRPFISPGDKLFEEIKTWKNWNPNVTYTDLSPES